MNSPQNAPANLALPISSLKGVGEKTCSQLSKSGIQTLFDALLRVPKSVIEENECPGFLHMETGRTYVALGRVVGVKISGSVSAKKRLEAVVEDETGRMSVIFFGPAINYVKNIIKIGAELIFTGEVKNFLGRTQMVHPKVRSQNEDRQGPTHQANYSQIAGITGAAYKKIVDRSLNLLRQNNFSDHLEPSILKSHTLLPLLEAIETIHQPDTVNQWDEKAYSPSFRRLAFEEILSFFVRLYKERSTEHIKKGIALPKASLEKLTNNFLPFSLTSAQTRVLKEIINDIENPQAMSRLIQGDVGSGKTAVSALVARYIINHGYQVALMAPTEILAEQLFTVYQKFFAKLDCRIALLTASTKTKERRELLEKTSQHSIDILIGTHALLGEEVNFKKLGLVIIDEQHRFGVKQRALLAEKFCDSQGRSPHLMVMSATPIPRSLALTMYGDLELSVIDERPPGRTPVLTKILSGDPIKNLLKLCERIIATDQKTFIVFPLVEESEHLDLENATKAAQILKDKFGDHSIGLLHGKMKADEKHQVMTEFRDNKIRFLVSTTVVEVGVDIPDATCMAIIHPERFGLAQLHQLRGRVGRGNLESFCFLLSNVQNKFSTAYQRLHAMCQSDDGFKLAQVDLKIRGPGELLGTKQAGVPNFLVFNHSDFANLVDPAKKLAQRIAQQNITHSTAHLHAFENPHFS
ncbi:MAG: ATP-dependent DNA helicase RecG [Myxococcales bacterium]|nr:MAG: ATP-dependent DNA helicase RecG [Myxococcales bacterium]